MFIVDSSGSMSNDQKSLGNAFSSFISEADKQSVDYNIGVVTTDVQRKHKDRSSGHPNLDQDPGILWGSPKVITPKTPDKFNSFKKNAKVGTSGSADERGLEAGKMALTPPLIDDKAYNGGFLRQDSKLVLILVSDEEDHSPAPVDFYTNFFKSIKGFRNDALFDFHAVVQLPTGHKNRKCTSSSSYDTGTRYVQVSQKTNGEQYSICNANWGTTLANLGKLAFGLRREFVLSRQADASTIEVTVDNKLQTARTHYGYDFAVNSVYFLGGHIPPKGSTIKVEYDTVCIKP